MEKTPVPFLIVGMFSAQFGAALATQLFAKLGPIGAVFLRLGFAATVLLIIWRPNVKSYSRAARIHILKFGLALCGMNFFFYEAIARIPLGIVVTIEFLGPLTLAIIGSKKRLDGLWITLAASGIALLTLADQLSATSSLDLYGICFALIAGVCWALFIVFAAQSHTYFQGGDALTLATCVGAIAFLIPGILVSGENLFQPSLLFIGLAVGFFSSVVTYSLETEALRHMPKNLFGILMCLEPAVATFCGWVSLGQRLSGRELLGVLLVVCASVGAERTTKLPITSEAS